MPIMITLSEGVRRKDVNTAFSVVSDILKSLTDTFKFQITEVNSWKKETSPSLGGEVVKKWMPEQASEENQFKSMMEEVLKSNILLVKGTIQKPDVKRVEVEFNLWSKTRKVYSDVLIDTSPSERENIIDVLWTESGQALTIDFVRSIAQIRTMIDGKNRKTVSEAVLSPELNDSDHFMVPNYIGFYSSKGQPYLLLKKVITNAVKAPGSGKTAASKLGLFNIDRFSKRVFELGIVQKRFEVVDRRVAKLPLGSLFFMAKDKESFTSLAEDINKQIVVPSLDSLDTEEDILERIKLKLETQDVKKFDT